MLLLDEPLAAVDQARKEEILPYLESLQRELKIPTLLVSHSRNEVARLSEHLLLMNEGRIEASGPTTALFSRLDLGPAHAADAAAVVEGIAAGHDREYGLNRIDFDGGRFLVAGPPLPSGTRVRLQVLARDVSLTLERQLHTSILNVFPATVTAITEENPAQVTVGLKTGSTALLSRITRKSADALQLAAGKPVYAQVKSVALLA